MNYESFDPNGPLPPALAANRQLLNNTPEWAATQSKLADLGQIDPYGVDYSNLGTMFQESGAGRQLESLQNNLDMGYQNALDQGSQMDQGALAALGENAGSASGDFQESKVQNQAEYGKTAALGKKSTLPEQYRMQKIESMKAGLVQQHMKDVDHQFSKAMRGFQDEFKSLVGSSEFRVSQQIEAQQQQLQKEYQDAQNSMAQVMQEHGILGDIFGTVIGGGAGLVAGIFAGNPIAGFQMGSKLGRSVGKLASSQTSYDATGGIVNGFAG